MDFEGCTTHSVGKRVVVREERSSFAIENPGKKQIGKITVDGCLINDARKRCDYVFEVGDPASRAIYVELKGKNIAKACEQLGATLGYLRVRHESVNRECRVVPWRNPLSGPQTQELRREFWRRYGVKLFIRGPVDEVTV